MGISMEENSTEEAQEGTIEKQITDEIPDKEKMAEISLDLDADYFKWKEEQEVGKQEEPKEKSIKDKADRLQKVLKNLTSGKK
jgi:hypothetical protein